MGKVEAAVKSEIVRLARKEVRSLAQHNAKAFRAMNARLSKVVAEVEALKRHGAHQVAQQRLHEVGQPAPMVEEQTRLSPGLIKKLRRRLDISQGQMARLLKVTPAAVGFWETGDSKPRPEMRARIIALRTLGRRDVKQLLDQERQSRS